MSGSDKRLRKKENARAAREAREAAVKRARRNRLLIRFAVLVAVFAIVVGVVSVVNDDDTDPGGAAERCVDTVPEPNPANDLQRDSAPPLEIDQEKTYVATVSTTCGDFEVELDAQNAPNTVNSFVYLANQGFYDGLTFHRLVDDFVIQGGDPNGDGSGDPGYATPDEPPLERYRRGSVAMANSGPNTSGSQFFVVLSQNGAENLGGPPYAYSILGQVTSGIDVVDLLASFVNPDENEVDISTQVPTRDLYIFSVEIDES